MQNLTVYPYKGKAFTIVAFTLSVTDESLTIMENTGDSSGIYLDKEQIVCIIPEKYETGRKTPKSLLVQTKEEDAPLSVSACTFRKQGSEVIFYKDTFKTPIENMYFNAAYVVAVYPAAPDIR